MKTIWLTPVLATGLALGLGGCADDDDSGPTEAMPDLRQAWADYGSGDLAEAGEAFLAAVAEHPSSAEAWCGLGWTRAALHMEEGAGDLREGVLAAFREADRRRAGYVDAWAGLAEYHHAVNDTLLALEWAVDAAEAGGADYVFAHRQGVNHRSLRKIAAWSLFKLGRYAEAGAQVRAVLPSFQYAGGADSLEVLWAGIGGL
jgi:tetratricopeptide (TPR) repeat protein